MRYLRYESSKPQALADDLYCLALSYIARRLSAKVMKRGHMNPQSAPHALINIAGGNEPREVDLVNQLACASARSKGISLRTIYVAHLSVAQRRAWSSQRTLDPPSSSPGFAGTPEAIYVPAAISVVSAAFATDVEPCNLRSNSSKDGGATCRPYDRIRRGVTLLHSNR